MTIPQNFGFSFSIISVITGIPSLFAYGLVCAEFVFAIVSELSCTIDYWRARSDGVGLGCGW